MPSRELPNIKLKGFWNLGEDAWKAENDQNLLKLSVLVQGGAIDIVSALPGSPVDGDVYINSTTDNICVRDAGAWFEITPLDGWWVYVRLQEQFYYFRDGAWAIYTGSGDLPPTTIDDAGKYVRVNSLGNGFELSDIEASELPIPEAGDEGKVPTVNATEDGYDLVTPAGGVEHVVLTQLEYDALSPPDADTFYFIPE